MDGIKDNPSTHLLATETTSLSDAETSLLENPGLDAEFPEDDWVDFSAESGEEAPLAPGVSPYKPADIAIQNELMERLQNHGLDKEPKSTLQFIAKKANPSWASFAWDNFVTALKECYAQKSLAPLLAVGLSLNCVYCTRAVDLTLHQILSNKGHSGQPPQMLEVTKGGAGLFNVVFENVSGAFSSRDNNGHYLDKLKTLVKPEERAAISVPVSGVKGRYSHAINLVNLGPGSHGSEDRIFIICGQSGRVFDLNDDYDVQAFYARHTNDSPGDAEHDVKFAITSGQQEELTSIFQQHTTNPLPESRPDFV